MKVECRIYGIEQHLCVIRWFSFTSKVGDRRDEYISFTSKVGDRRDEHNYNVLIENRNQTGYELVKLGFLQLYTLYCVFQQLAFDAIDRLEKTITGGNRYLISVK